jgi:DNA-binding GntR family transcriptional regulator
MRRPPRAHAPARSAAPASAPPPASAAPAAPAVAADRVYEAIYGAVVDHRLPPGARLREEELAQAFAVSRTLVRQALHRLAQNGVVLLRPNRGAQVPEPTRRDGEHVFDARRVVECEVARRLAGALSPEQAAELRRVVKAETRAHEAGDRSEAIRLSGEFHRLLAHMSGNPIFVRMLDELLPTTSLLMALYKAPGEPMCVAHSHDLLLKVLEGQGGASAAAEMRRHLNEIERSLSMPAPQPAPALRDVFKAYRDG